MTHSAAQTTVTELVDAHLSSGKPIRFKVTSNSMHPQLQIGDAVLVQSITAGKTHIGDLLVTQRDDGYLTHRLIQKSRKKWLTKGDNNLVPDPPVYLKAITGRVVQIQRSDKIIRLETRKWHSINRLAARLSFLEWKFFSIHRYLRLPFRLLIKVLQKSFFK